MSIEDSERKMYCIWFVSLESSEVSVKQHRKKWFSVYVDLTTIGQWVRLWDCFMDISYGNVWPCGSVSTSLGLMFPSC